MKEGDVLNVLTPEWQTINKIKKKLNCHWEKVFAQLCILESKGLAESVTIPQKNNVYRHFRKVTADEHTLSVIERTPIRERSSKDHKYYNLHKHKNNWRSYIDEIIKQVENESNK